MVRVGRNMAATGSKKHVMRRQPLSATMLTALSNSLAVCDFHLTQLFSSEEWEARMLRQIFAAIRRILGSIFRVPFDLLTALGGGPGPVMPPDAHFEYVADDQADDLRHDLRSPVAEAGTAFQTLGGHVHAYAAAHDRLTYDLSAVPDELAVTLLSMSDRELSVLAAAGPETCGLWAAGRRCGIVGLPRISETEPAAAPEPDVASAPSPKDEPHDGPLLRLAA